METWKWRRSLVVFAGKDITSLFVKWLEVDVIAFLVEGTFESSWLAFFRLTPGLLYFFPILFILPSRFMLTKAGDYVRQVPS